MSKEQARLLRFALKYPGWQSYCSKARPVVKSLEQHGLLEVNEYKQFRIIASQSTTERDSHG